MLVNCLEFQALLIKGTHVERSAEPGAIRGESGGVGEEGREEVDIVAIEHGGPTSVHIGLAKRIGGAGECGEDGCAVVHELVGVVHVGPEEVLERGDIVVGLNGHVLGAKSM